MFPASDSELAALQERINYHFRQPSLLEIAVTHPSYLQEHSEVPESNQRMEFLGDAVVQLVLTETLFGLFPTEREGSLSMRRSALSKGRYLTKLAQDIGLGGCLRLGPSEDTPSGRARPAALEDSFEALIGAVYLDSDYATARKVVLDLYGSLPAQLAVIQPEENPKGRLQELVQPLRGNGAVRYEVLHIAGEDHAREYEARVYLGDRFVGSGRGTSKKNAEESAAREALQRIEQEKVLLTGTLPPPRVS